jgi:hypothetical protein
MPKSQFPPAEINRAALYPAPVFASMRGESLSQFYDARRRSEVESPAINEAKFVRWTGAQILRNLEARVALAQEAA